MRSSFLTEPSRFSGTGLEFNLECERGHRHYSPEPDALIGGACGYATLPIGEAKKVRLKARTCTAVLGSC